MMELKQLLQALSGFVFSGNQQQIICALTDDSRRVVPGSMFIAVAGSQKDGLQYAQQALDKGASVVVSESVAPPSFADRWIQVPDVKQARLHFAQVYYGHPFASLKVHGVTGTSGKTTTAYLMEAVLVAAGEKVAMLGTVCLRIGARVVPSELTTPGVLDLHAFAAQAVAEGCKHLVMEVSSHALDQGRVAGMLFDSCLFSNLSRDHLDYHKTFEEYFAAKKLLFTKYRRGSAIVNVDDEYGARLATELLSAGDSVLRVSRLGRSAEFVPQAVLNGEDGISLELPVLGTNPFQSRLCGDFNADNVLLVCGWVMDKGYSVQALRKALQNVNVPGRFEMAFNDGLRRVLVDYAHKPDALERVLTTVRDLCKRKLIVVFGCGGDRDQGKRPLMGAIAEEHADMCFVTSDNPRTEDPQEILRGIVAGMHKNNHTVIADRALAIQAACRTMDTGDWLVVAGKGHEDYQIIGTTKHPFDDRKVVREAFGC